MVKKLAPRAGSMQYWPRKRASKTRIRFFPKSDFPLQGFAGYKVGMIHVMATDNRKASVTKGEQIQIPATIIECPELVLFGFNAYKNKLISKTVTLDKTHKHLARRLKKNKKNPDLKILDEDYDFHGLFHTQPYKTNFGKKRPEVFEIPIDGTSKEQAEYIKKHLGKEISVSESLKEGQLVDIHGITKGKGSQGPVKRFGVSLRSHKSEKTIRGPGSLGGWKGHAHIMYRVAHAGQMGHHLRTKYNNWVLKIGEKDIEKGFRSYGIIKNKYLLVKGSVPGAAKRLVKITGAQRPNKKFPNQAPVFEMIL